MEPTPTQRLATLKLERDVVEWAVERRAADPQPSFRTIATELRQMTGVDVTDETVRLWCAKAQYAACPLCPNVTWHNSDPCPYEAAS